MALRRLAAPAYLALWCFFPLAYPLWPSLAVARGGWSALAPASWLGLALHLLVYLGLTLCYLLLTDERRGYPPLAARWAVALWLLASLALLLAAPHGESHDLFDYVFRGRMLAEYGLSPLAVTPITIRSRPFASYVSWHDHVDTYGPLWEYASASVAAIVGPFARGGNLTMPCPSVAFACDALAAYLTGYRLLAIGLTGLTGALIWQIAARGDLGQVAPGQALSRWLLNPLVVIAAGLGAHNELPLTALLLWSLWLALRRRPLLALLALLLAAHVKLTALLLLPPLLVWLAGARLLARCALPSGARPRLAALASISRTSLDLAAALIIALPISLALYWPLGGWATLPRMLDERGRFLAGSLAHAIYRELIVHNGWAQPDAWRITTQGATLGFGLLALPLLLLLAWRIYRARAATAALLLRGCAAVLLAYLAVGAFWFQHWYIVTLAALVALLPPGPMRRALPWLGFGALAANIVADALGALPGLTLDRAQLGWVSAIVAFAPLLLLPWNRRRLPVAPVS